MENHWLIGTCVFGTLAFLGGLIWLSIRYAMRRQELTHLERQLMIERGYPLPDVEEARCRTLAWIGTTVPIGSLTIASGVSTLLIPQHMEAGLIAVWSACGATAAGGNIGTVMRLRAHNSNHKTTNVLDKKLDID